MKKELALFVLVFSLFACESEDILESNAIDSNIQITPTEFFGEPSPQLGLSCKSEKIYPCINFHIVTEVDFKEDIISVDFIEIPEIDICLTAFGPATTTIDFSDIANGEYELELNNASIRNTGRLIITDTSITLDFSSQKGIQILRETTKRVPNNTYWGKVGYHTETTIDKVNEFLDKLKVKNGVSNFNNQKPGIYSFYEINQDGEIIPREISGYHFVKYFIFQYDGDDEEKFKDEIKTLSRPYFEELRISFQNSSGERINNRN
jgi:hypothetical protein